jgi:beta-phosphoglucomutase-like phosphatase (HAD superfamily)
VQGVSDNGERGNLVEIESVLEDAFWGLKELYRLEREEDYAKKQQLFKSRGRTISRIGLANVRKSKMAKLEAEQRAYEENFRRHEHLLPGLKILLTLSVTGGAT